jgi:uncharacterized membrane protein (UPF0127 family)
MPPPAPLGYAYNRTRRAYLATQLSFADTHWSRLRGLMGTKALDFRYGQGLWITPSRGVHTFAMSFPIDVVYLDRDKVVLHVEKNLKPWRVAPVFMKAVSVLELPDNTLNSSGTAVGDEIEIERGSAQEADGA